MAYFAKAKSLFSTTLSTSISTGTGETITPASVSGLPTDTEVTLTIDRVDSNGTSTPTKTERIRGTISGGNLTSYTRGVDSTTEQSHTAGAVIEYVFNAADWNDMLTGLLVDHEQDGTHEMTSPEVTTGINDANDNEMIKFSPTSSAANEITVTNAIATGTPIIAASGDDTNIDLTLKGKGTGGVIVASTGNGTVLEVDNDGTGQGLYITQDGVLATNQAALGVMSDAIQVNAALVALIHENSSSTANLLYLRNDGTGSTIELNQTGVLGASQFGLYIHSNAVQINAALVKILQDNASSTEGCVYVDNDGTGSGIVIIQDGVLGATKYGLYVYSNAAQVTSDLVLIKQANASSTAPALVVDSESTSNVAAVYFYGKPINTSGVVKIVNEDTGGASDGLDIQLGPATVGTSNEFVKFLDGDGNIVGDIDQEVAYNTFTGAHASQSPTDQVDNLVEGMIMSSTGEVINADTSSIANSQSATRIADQPNDPTVLGVFAGFKLGDYTYKGFNKKKHTYMINALGEGKVLVTNKNGDVHNGDYITSSDIAGYGQKQDDDILHSYTVAKATEDVNWDRVKTQVEGYKSVLIGCTYHCG